MNPRPWKRLVRLEPFPQPPILRTAYPVVLMHGFGALAAVHRGGQLHAEAMHLRRHGVLAFAPNVPPYNPVRVRVRFWRQRIEQVLHETGAAKVNLVAHSMGGLDARYLIHEPGMHAVVASLVTVSTPHQGTPLCDLVHERPERLQSWLGRFFDGLGNASLAGIESDARAAVAELTPAYVCETFNPAVADHPDVRYWSYAGRAGRGTDVPISPFLVVQNRFVYRRAGVNDGLVPVESAKWGTFLGTVDADHVQQVGIRLSLNTRFRSETFYRTVAEMLAREGL